MGVQYQVLSEAEREKIHAESIRILEEIGVKFLSDKALKILSAHGARVDRDSKIAKIPRALVDQALATAPGSFALGARDPERDFALPSSYSGYILDNGGVFARDFQTGERRNTNFQDLIDFNRVFDEMKLAAVAWPATLSGHFPPHSSSLRTDIYSMMYSSLHIQSELWHPREVPFLLEALTAILGDEKSISERKLYSVVYCTLAPLVHEGGMCDAYLELIEFDAPVLIFPMPCAGTTGPCSMFSTIAMGNAEALSSLTLFQLARPGTPLIFGDAGANANFTSGSFLEGSPEMVLITAARGEMARFYGLPNSQAGCLSDAKDHGAQAVMEKLITTLPLVLNGTDLIQGPGALETSNTMTLEQIVVDDEIACLCKRIKEGVDFSDAKNLFEDIKQVQPGGHFLMTDNTLANCRSDEFLVPMLCDRNTYERWCELGRPDVYSKAKEKVEEILAQPQKNPLPDDVIGKLEDIMKRADQALN